ncbi:hypothetical protein C0J52_14935 [Blattella germanica]|nr:hypothetical protein C0J52_14935 [Blattella germanica]PSN49908.1 hypothetical protein C0J52_14935 [Blattella germanica]
MKNLGLNILKVVPCIHKIEEQLRGRRFATQEDIANAVRQQMNRFTHGAANAKAEGIKRLPHRWQRVVTVAGDYSDSI